VARFGRHAVELSFTSDRFDHSSELPVDANAGNRFYGRDVAEFVTEGLAGRGLVASFLDEDWGWQVHARRADGSVLEVSIYHNPEEEAAREDEWLLLVRLLRRGLLRSREVEVDPDVVSTLEDVFRGAGIAVQASAAQRFG